MGFVSPAWRARLRAARGLLVLLLTLVLVMPQQGVGPSSGAFGWIARPSFASAAWAAELPAARSSVIPAEGHYRCDGEALSTVFQPGAVDAVDLPNQSAGTLPGSFLVVRWRGIQLQLPRTNDAGPPRFSDGKWLWQFNPGEPPRFLLRQGLGEVQEFGCEAVADRLAEAPEAERAGRS